MAIPILAFGFLAPALMGAGAAAVSIPIIIHLLNKRRFRVIVWAAMEFLLAAQRRNARRLKMHRWLLLAVRCLALLLIAAGMARLVVDSNVFGGALGGERAVIVIWDDSYSMAFQKPGEPSAFDKSKKLLTSWLENGDLSPGDKVMVIHASRNGVRAGNQPTLDRSALLASIRGASVTDAETDLSAAIDQASDTLKGLEASTRTRQVILLTNFANSALRPAGVGGGEEALKKQIAALNSHATNLRVIDVGTADQFNTAITDLRSHRSVVVAGTPSEFLVTAFNASDHPQIDLPVTLSLDGVVLHTEKLGKIEPGALRTIVAAVTIPTPGRHVIQARLPGDLLPLDDSRELIVNARHEVPILLVDGSPGSTMYLWAAYGLVSSDGTLGSVFAPRRVTETELPMTVLADYSEIVLADTAAPSPAFAQNLRRFVETGGLLMIFPGDHTNAQLMNQALSGVGLLPATLGQPVRLSTSAEMAKGIGFAAEGFSHPILEKFRDASKSGADFGFLSVQTSEYLKLGVPQDGSVETLLRYTQANGTPGDAAIVSKPLGKGRVVLFASSADNQWNTWGGKPSFVPVIHELTYYSLPGESAALNYRVGDSINLPGDIASPGMWTAPRNGTLSVSAEVDKEGLRRLRGGPLPAAGLYSPPSGDGRAVVAANPDGDGADIRHISIPQAAAALGIDAKNIDDRAVSLNAPSSLSLADSGASLLGPTLIGAALLLFMIEALLAMAFSTYR